MHAVSLPDSKAHLRPALGLLLLTLAGCGLLYAQAATRLTGALFPAQANGSLVLRDGKPVGSLLVAQPFSGDGWFQPRPSAAGYNPMAAAGSNQARSNPALRARIDAAIAEVAQREGVAPSQVPVDLVTQSGGGLDPHLTPAAARIQIARVARTRGLDDRQVETLVQAATEPALWGVFGQPRVNVLELNLAVEALARSDTR
ncbi:potassium-transporting ATPase subunit KdpC [Pseudoxanthomonas composti]|uniref:Potassium-transporting ATPase KdpC subunit n=1 Tax=Pseudoxanthomonas composti TaxID=2137479 RepID=A0A4Q1JW81_9GAMM|nr:potassium-transporting ATPase subunit KdpC [Pseudoxanthomonas composti]RXR06425.1 potassium-transporting ATPase subunit KdpC [Pseudoxanthomonas composti]